MPPTADQSSRPSVQADYLNLADATGQPLAGLLILLSPAGEPVRAELHVARGLPKLDEEEAVRQTQTILRNRYAVAADATVPLYVMQMDLGAVSEVQLPAAGDSAKAARHVRRALRLQLRLHLRPRASRPMTSTVSCPLSLPP